MLRILPTLLFLLSSSFIFAQNRFLQPNNTDFRFKDLVEHYRLEPESRNPKIPSLLALRDSLTRYRNFYIQRKEQLDDTKYRKRYYQNASSIDDFLRDLNDFIETFYDKNERFNTKKWAAVAKGKKHYYINDRWWCFYVEGVLRKDVDLIDWSLSKLQNVNEYSYGKVDLENIPFLLKWIEQDRQSSIYKIIYRKYQILKSLKVYESSAKVAAYCNKELLWWLGQEFNMDHSYQKEFFFINPSKPTYAKTYYSKSLDLLGTLLEQFSTDIDSNSRQSIPIQGLDSFLVYDFSKQSENAYQSRLRLYQHQLRLLLKQGEGSILLEQMNLKRIKFMHEQKVGLDATLALKDHVAYFKLTDKNFPEALGKELALIQCWHEIKELSEALVLAHQNKGITQLSDSMLWQQYQLLAAMVHDSTKLKLLGRLIVHNKSPFHHIAKIQQLNLYLEGSYQITNRSKADSLAQLLLKEEQLLQINTEPFFKANTQGYSTTFDPETFEEVKIFNFVCSTTRLYQLVFEQYLEYFDLEKSLILGKNPAIFSPTNTFIKTEFPKENSRASLAIKGFQKILELQLESFPNDTIGFLSWEMARLEKMHQISFLGNRDELYLQAFHQLLERYKSSSYTSRLGYELVQLYRRLGEPYEKSPHQYAYQRFYWKKALNLAQDLLKKYPEDSYSAALRKLVKELARQKLALSAERYVAPHRPFKIMATTRNVDAIKIKVYPLKRNPKKQAANQYTDAWVLADSTAIQNYSLKNLSNGDLRQNQIELPMKALPPGNYELKMYFLKHDKRWHEESVEIQVSSIMPIIENQKDSIRYYFVDRSTGAPIPNISIWAYQITGDSLAPKAITSFHPETFEEQIDTILDTVFVYDWVKIGGSSPAATFSMEKKKRWTYDENGNPLQTLPFYRNLKFISQQDSFWMDEVIPTPSRYYRPEEPQVKKIHFFSDRAIYQPGQTVYFKGILSDGEGRVLADSLATTNVEEATHTWTAHISLIDSRGQPVDDAYCKINSYGSFSDSFYIPPSQLAGDYRIVLDEAWKGGDYKSPALAIKGGDYTIKVEHYKRPSFSVNFMPIKQHYNVTDEVSVKGNVKAFAGYPIANAKVQYTINKRVVHPYVWTPWWKPRPQAEIQEATAQKVGYIESDAAGNFNIQFTGSLSIQHQPATQYYYDIKVNVSDPISGETHESTTTVKLSEQALQISMQLPLDLETGKSYAIPLRAFKTEAMQEDYPAQLRIYKLKPPQQPKHYAIWERPTDFILSQKEHDALFPNYPYDMEYEFRTWGRGELLIDSSFNSGSVLSYQLASLEEGDYVAEFMVIDSINADTLKVEERFQVFDWNNKTCALSLPFWARLEQKVSYVDDSISFKFASAKEEVYALLRIEQSDRLLYRKWIKIEGKTIHKVAVTEDFKGDVHYYIDAVMDNRKYQYDGAVEIRYSPTKLQIEYISFRDKLLPGQKESWKIRISDQFGKPLQAEVLATLYDASLDVLKPHQFQMKHPFLRYKRHSLGLDWHQLFELEYSQGAYTYSYDTVVAFDPESFEEAVNVVTNAEAPKQVVAKLGREANRRYRIGGILAQPKIPLRKKLNENVFFLPHLYTNKKGEIEIPFVMNEALTKWRLLIIAHTQNMEFEVSDRTVITQKKLMVQPNVPRFARVGDQLEFTVKLTNLSSEGLSGRVKLEILDPKSMKPIQCFLPKVKKKIRFKADSMQSLELSWALQIPEGYHELVYRIVAQSKSYSDGEQGRFKILPKEMLAVRAHPIFIDPGQEKDYSLNQAFANTKAEHDVKSYQLELSSNPAWDALRSLPYLMEYPYECSEQLLNRYYANTLASSVLDASPQIRQIFTQWREEGLSKSDLEENQALTSILLEESPWLASATNEEEIRHRLGILFDLGSMSRMQETALDKLVNRQNINGGFGWFNGGRPNRYISQYVVESFGHLLYLNTETYTGDRSLTLHQQAQDYVDQLVIQEYQNWMGYIQETGADSNRFELGRLQLHYLYARSFTGIEDSLTAQAYDFVLEQAWRKRQNFAQNHYLTGMIALALHRRGRKTEALLLADSLKARALYSEHGMYWKTTNGYYWYQAKLETQALMIELFVELGLDVKDVQAMKVWLLQNKTEHYWSSTKATAAATYALLLGDNWLEDGKVPQIHWNNKSLSIKEEKMEAGTGHLKKRFEPSEAPRLRIKNQNESVPLMGNIFQTYSSPIDAILVERDSNSNYIHQQLYKVIFTSKGDSLVAISDSTVLERGDRVRVALHFHASTALEFVHLKSQHPSGFDPVQQLSAYHYKNGMYFYQANSKAATNFFIELLPKGKHYLSYDMFVNQRGQYQSGFTMLQSMYAPEYSVYDKSRLLKVD